MIFADNVHSLGSFLKSHKINSLVGVAVNMKQKEEELDLEFLVESRQGKLQGP